MQAGPSTLPPAHRLHISGISPSTRPEDLRERFSRYGAVEGVDTVGPDALGRERTYAFLTLRASAQDLAKCMNTMQGAMWRGGKLKIGEAKLRWDVRLEQERNPALAPPPTEKEAKRTKIRKRKLKRRSLARCGGTQLADMRVVDAEKAVGRKHWHLTPAGLPVRPIYTRPTHPLEASTVPPISNNDAASAHPLRKSIKRGRPLQIKRARRVYLDPGLWGAQYLNEDQLAGDADEGGAEQRHWHWEWVEADEGADDIQGRWELRTGDVVEADEPVPAKRARVEALLQAIPAYERQHADSVRTSYGRPQPARMDAIEDIFPDGEDEDDADDELWGALPRPEVEEMDEDAALFPVSGRTAAGKRSAAPAAPRVDERVLEPVLELVSEDEDVFEAGAELDVPGSPLFASHSAGLFDSDDESVEIGRAPQPHLSDVESSSGDGAGSETSSDSASASEGSEDVEMVDAAASSSSSSESSSSSPNEATDSRADGGDGADDGDLNEGSDATSSSGSASGDGDQGGDGPDKPNKDGGAEESDGSDDETDSEDSEESSAESSSSTAESEGDRAVKAASSTKATTAPTGLKALFGAPPPRSGAGGALFSTLDLDLDEDMDIPATVTAAPVTPIAEPVHALEALVAEPLAPLNQARSAFVADPTIPLFLINTAQRAAGGNASKAAAAPSIGDLMQADGFVPFHRQETDQHMIDDWNANKLELTREYKKRHREAVKRRRRGRADLDQEE